MNETSIRLRRARKTSSGGSFKGEFYRQTRQWHGWLSAAAFLALMFFSATGLLLNHPEWFKSEAAGKPAEQTLTLTDAERVTAKDANDPARALADIVGKKIRLRGAYQGGELLDGQALIRFEGVAGSSDITVDLETGETEVSIEKATLVTTINELHRGKNAGAVWKTVIDASAILVLALSLVGYVLFFSLRFRLKTSLILTGGSLAVLLAIFFLFVP